MSIVFSKLVQRAIVLISASGLLITASGTAEARTKDRPLSPRAEIWRGYGDHGYVMQQKSNKRYGATKRSFSAAVKASGYKTTTSKTAYRKSKGVKYAALNYGTSDVRPKTSITGGGGVRWAASSSCLNGTLVALISSVAANYGSVTVSSTCRSKSSNAAAGGAKRSQHLTGNAVDFRVHGNYSGMVAFLRSHSGIGGVKHYGGGLFHADTGPKRSW